MPSVHPYQLSLTVFISGANKETMAFYKTYQDDLDDDNEEFAHMQDLAVDMLHLPGDDQDVEMAAEDEEEEEEPRRVVTTLELKRELQMASRNNEVCLILIMIHPVAHFAPAR